MGTYWLSADVDSGSSWSTSSLSSDLYWHLVTAAKAGQLAVPVPAGFSSTTAHLGHWTGDSHGGSWVGDYGVAYDVASAGTSVTYGWDIRSSLSRSASGTSVAAGLAFSGTGLKTASVSVSSTFHDGRPIILFGFRATNSNMMAAEAVTLNLAGSYITVPWAVGEPSGQDESGGAASSVHVTGSGAGSAVESAAGGATAAVNISAEGAGSADQPGEQHETGGAAATVNVSADASGVAAEHADGAATATVNITAQGAGQTDEAPTLQVTILSPTSAQLVWA